VGTKLLNQLKKKNILKRKLPPHNSNSNIDNNNNNNNNNNTMSQPGGLQEQGQNLSRSEQAAGSGQILGASNNGKDSNGNNIEDRKSRSSDNLNKFNGNPTQNGPMNLSGRGHKSRSQKFRRVLGSGSKCASGHDSMIMMHDGENGGSSKKKGLSRSAPSTPRADSFLRWQGEKEAENGVVKHPRRRRVMRAAVTGSRARRSTLPTWSASSGTDDDGSYYEDDAFYSDYSADSSSALSRGTRMTKSLMNRSRSKSPMLPARYPSAATTADNNVNIDVDSVDQDNEGRLPSSSLLVDYACEENDASATTAATSAAAAAATPEPSLLRQRRTDGGGRNAINGAVAATARKRSGSRDCHNEFRITTSTSVRKLRRHDTFSNLQNKLAMIVQICVFLVVAYLLFDSHSKSNLIAIQLKEYKDQESILFLHLHRIQEHSLQLHESMERFSQEGVENASDQNNNASESRSLSDGDVKSNNQPQQQPKKAMFRGAGLNMDLIHKQTQQLLQMEEEINHEVRSLQARVQQSAVRSIVREYGEGPVQIVLELQLDGETTRSQIAILLWHDTPHAAWTWLEQINRGLWHGASFHMDNTRILSANPLHPDTETHLDFVEKSSQTHEAFTVGLSDNPSTGGLEMFINLDDNTDFSRYNVCVGKVFDGFGVLNRIMSKVQDQKQRMIELSEQHAGSNNKNNYPEEDIRPVKILSAKASHLTKRSIKGLVR